MSELFGTPQKMTLTNLFTDEDVEMQFNPEQLEESVSATWSRFEVLGHGHQPMQFQQTGNHTMRLALYHDAVTQDEVERIEEIRKFLLSLCYPTSTGDGPPRVLFTWPNFVSFTAVVNGEMKLQHTQFLPDGRPTRTNITLPLEEIRDGTITSEEVRQWGTRRPRGS